MANDSYSTPTWRWEPNILVSIWGRGKATLVDKSKCPLSEAERKGTENNGSEPQYPGDCDNCCHFRGCDLSNVEPVWGVNARGCCAFTFETKKEVS